MKYFRNKFSNIIIDIRLYNRYYIALKASDPKKLVIFFRAYSLIFNCLII